MRSRGQRERGRGRGGGATRQFSMQVMTDKGDEVSPAFSLLRSRGGIALSARLVCSGSREALCHMSINNRTGAIIRNNISVRDFSAGASAPGPRVVIHRARAPGYLPPSPRPAPASFSAVPLTLAKFCRFVIYSVERAC